MAIQVLTQPKIWVGGFDFSGFLNSAAVEYGAEMLDSTAFGDATRKNEPGLKNASVSNEGYWDSVPDAELFNNIGLADVPVSIGPETGADGERAFAMKANYSNYSPGGSVGELLAFSVNAEADEIVRATIMHNAIRTATGNGTARQLGAVAAGQKLYATLHVIAASVSDTLDVIVESDDNSGMTTPVTRITFTQATAVSSQWATPVAGAITDDWWRVGYTIGGASPSFTFIVIIGIQ